MKKANMRALGAGLAAGGFLNVVLPDGRPHLGAAFVLLGVLLLMVDRG